MQKLGIYVHNGPEYEIHTSKHCSCFEAQTDDFIKRIFAAVDATYKPILYNGFEKYASVTKYRAGMISICLRRTLHIGTLGDRLLDGEQNIICGDDHSLHQDKVVLYSNKIYLSHDYLISRKINFLKCFMGIFTFALTNLARLILTVPDLIRARYYNTNSQYSMEKIPCLTIFLFLSPLIAALGLFPPFSFQSRVLNHKIENLLNCPKLFNKYTLPEELPFEICKYDKEDIIQSDNTPYLMLDNSSKISHDIKQFLLKKFFYEKSLSPTNGSINTATGIKQNAVLINPTFFDYIPDRSGSCERCQHI